MIHPTETSLALHAGGELALLARWRMSRHLARCAVCRAEVEAFRSVRGELLESASELPAELNWGRLAGDMRANIHLGLSAGECVGAPEARPRLPFGRLAAVVAPAMVLILIGLLLQHPQPRPPATAWVEGSLLEATKSGIELRQGDRMLSLLHPQDESVTYAVSVQGTLRARYFDADTGQVTIQNVYAQ